jgi:hypothetical protein
MIHFPYIFLRVGVGLMVSLPPGQQQPERKTIVGLWRDRAEDGVALQEALREEWASFGLMPWLGLDY